MRMRSVNIRNLAATILASRHLWGIILIPIVLAAFPFGYAQQATAPKTPKGMDNLDLPYISDKGVADKIATAPVGFINEISTSQEGKNLVITVNSSCQPSFQEFELGNPARLVVDFLNVENRASVLNYPIGSAGVKQLRVRQYLSVDPKIARLVFDLDRGYGNHEIAANSQGVRIVFHPAEGGAIESPKPPAPALAAATQNIDAGLKPAPATAKMSQIPAHTEPETDSPPPLVPVISDLSVSEIPQSALVTASAQPSVRVPPPSVKEKPAPPKPAAQPAPPPPAPAGNPFQEGYSGHPLTLDLVNIALVDFFRLMSEEGGLNIVVDPEVKGTTSIKMTKAPWDQIFDVVLKNNGLDKQVDGNVVRIATKKTIQAEAKQREDLKKAELLAADVETRVRRLNYAKSESILEVLKDQMTARGLVVDDKRTSSLILTDIPSSLDRVVQIIDELDTPEPQVEIEARIVSANRDFARDIGIQFGFIQGNLQRVTVGGPNTFSTIGGTRPSATPTNTYAAGNPITGRGSSQSSSTQSGATSTGPNSTNNSGNYNVNLPSQLPFGGLGLSVGNIFDTFLLDAAITAGETKGQAKLISQPKLTTQNNSPGMITQGLRFPVQVIANNTVSVQFQNAALTLTVVPQITSEGNIVLDLKIENNTPDFGRQVMGIPSIRTSESTTRVLVSDGGTTVIGGILIDNEETQVDGIPGLSSLPIFGNFFKRNMVSHSSQEVLFFITPKIVK
jgi:type IV pilus secretin PilQ/predicted competence protein